jgi:hypothetical protein
MSGWEFKRGPTRPLLEENAIVDARVAGVEYHEFVHQNKKIEKLKWLFTVTEPDNEWFGADIIGETSINFNPHPNCKPYHWVKALTGKAFSEDDPAFSTDNLIGLPCRILIEHKPGKEGTIWMRVKEVIPAGKASKAAIEQPTENPF